ncbi:MAG: hypothetical protein R3Y28_00940 [Candidatus Gastranaerophilales bacterium]
MKKFLLALFLIFCINTPAFCVDIQDVTLEMRDYDSIEIPAGTFIPVMNAQEISTQYSQEGYKVKFIATTSLYLYDTIIIPENSEFYGYIEKVNEPVIGTHSSMKIKITKMIIPNGIEIPLKGYIYSSNDNTIGGGIAPPSEYIKVAHYSQKVSRATLQIRPGKGKQMGTHTQLKSGDNFIIVLTAPASITHVLTD